MGSTRQSSFASQDAASVAGALITTEATIAEPPADDKSPAGMPSGGMGEMDF
jgi:chaperonin GroEL